MRPHLKILVIEDAVNLLEQITSSIGNTIAYFDRSDLDVSLLEANSVSKALQFVREDGDIQALASQKLTVQGIYDGDIYVVAEG